MNNNNKTFATKLIIALSILIAGLSCFILIFYELPDKPMAGQGSNITAGVEIGGDFTLTDQNGQEFSNKQLRGKYNLIYFGFTYCPDICPTSMYKLADVLTTLDKYGIDINAVFISVDPLRDSPQILKEYLHHFHPKLIGLTGSEAKIKEVADKFKVYYAKSASSEDEDYMIYHTSIMYLMDKEGKYFKHFSIDTPAPEIIEFIRINKDK
jgi:protein SCO1/2